MYVPWKVRAEAVLCLFFEVYNFGKIYAQHSSD